LDCSPKGFEEQESKEPWPHQSKRIQEWE